MTRGICAGLVGDIVQPLSPIEPSPSPPPLRLEEEEEEEGRAAEEAVDNFSSTPNSRSSRRGKAKASPSKVRPQVRPVARRLTPKEVIYFYFLHF